MPRPNQPRSIASEEALARRIAYERDVRGMSYEGLASRMTKVGCPIQASGVYKIEKAGRRITVDELVGFAQVFGIPVEKLLLPPESAASEAFTDLMVDWNRKRQAAASAKAAEDEAWKRVHDYVEEHPDLAEVVEPVITAWVSHYFDEEHREGAVALRMYELTGAPEWDERLREWMRRGTGEAV